MKFIYIIALLLIVCTSCNDYHRNIFKENKIKLEYRMEHGFGNDTFDIYSFSVDKEFNTEDFRAIDNDYKEISRIFKGLLETELSDSVDSINVLNEIKENMELLEKEADCLYLYIHDENSGKRELYLYSKKLNLGYYFISKI